MDAHADCPCCSERMFSACCGPLVNGVELAATAEALMRSRYTAYVLEKADYLRATWHSSTRPSSLGELSGSGWCGLRIIRTQAGGADDAQGVVEFVASAIEQGKPFQLHEVSRFVKEAGQWFYVDGDVAETVAAKVGRNDPCPCGSGKKYKKCCGG